MKKHILHHKVDLLNLPGHHSDASIFSKVINEGDRWLDGELLIRDCYKRVEFVFDFKDAADKKNNLHKVDTMIKHLQQLRKALVEVHKVKIKKEKVIMQNIVDL